MPVPYRVVELEVIWIGGDVRSPTTIILGLILGAATMLGWPIATRQAKQGTPVDQLAWLTGCWAYTSPRVIIEEHWTSPAAGRCSA